MKYTAKFGIDGGASPGFGVKEPDSYNKEEEFELFDKFDDERVIAYAVFLGRKIACNALSNPETDLTKVTLLNILGPDGVISQKDFASKYNGLIDKTGKSFSFKTNELSQIVLEDHSFEKLLRL